MTLREALGGDAKRIHQLVDALLDREDAVLLLFDGGCAVTYAEGFGVSASQLELLGVELERSLRTALGGPAPKQAATRRNRERNQGGQHADRINGDRRGQDHPAIAA